MHYAHACSCGRYENTCKRLPQHTVIAIILYLDGTQATRKISGQSTKPVVLTLGNFTIPVMNKGCAKRILTYMPSPKATAKVVKRASADWLLSKRLVYHDAWRQMLAPLVAAQRNGGGYLYLPYTGASGAVQWHQKLCMPTIAYVVNDTPERKLLTLVGDSAKQPRPCSACTIAKDDLAKGDVSCDYVTNDRHRRMGMDSKRFVLRTAAQVAAAPTRGASSTKKQIIDESWKARGMHLIPNAFWDVAFFDDYGIYGHAGPDRMHCWYVGGNRCVLRPQPAAYTR